MFHVPNKYRWRNHPIIPSHDGMGNRGFFVIPHFKISNCEIKIQASEGFGWEHVSVSIGEVGKKSKRVPNWAEMCYVKDLFWDEEDTVIQFHPAKSQYVNLHEFVLHLWRPTNEKLPIPIKEMVG